MFPVRGVSAAKTKWKMSVSGLFGSSSSSSSSSRSSWQTSPQQRIKQISSMFPVRGVSAAKTKWRMSVSGLYLVSAASAAEAAAAGKHQGNKEIKNIFYVSGPGRICSQDKMENVSFRAILGISSCSSSSSWQTSRQQRIKEYLLSFRSGAYLQPRQNEKCQFQGYLVAAAAAAAAAAEASAADKHQGNKELNKYLLCFRSGAYLQPRQNEKCQFQGYIWYQQHQQQKQQQLTNIKATKN